MFGLRYFAKRFFGGRFFGPTGDDDVVIPPAEEPEFDCPCTEETETDVTALAADTATSVTALSADTTTVATACAADGDEEVGGCFRNTAQTYTASCPYGFSGDDVTVVVAANTVFSAISQAAANARALHNARLQALTEIVCTAVSGSTRSYYPPVGAGQLHE